MIITNLFSIFDPSLSLFSFSWLRVFLLCLILPSFYFNSGSILCFFFNFFNLVGREINYILSQPKKGVYSFISSIFVVIFVLNFFAIFPHFFSITSHLSFTLPFSFSFWFMIIVFSWTSSLKSFLAHLVPSGTPFSLISFIVLVEALRNIIRPLALTFRLTANIIAGHLIMSLVGGALIGLNPLLFGFGFTFSFFLTFMELGVCLVQAYVFSSLILLYVSERDQ